jgi:hypothetical protein
VATLWPVHDLIVAEFSHHFHAAGSVTAAARILRHGHPDHPNQWAVFLHYGL